LDNVDRVATKYNDLDLLAKSKEVRNVTLQYKDLFNQSMAMMVDNSAEALVMTNNGTKVTDLARKFFTSKVGKTDETTLAQLPILEVISNTSMEIRLNQNKYMLYRNTFANYGLSEGCKAGWIAPKRAIC
jgi:hypothetical protein